VAMADIFEDKLHTALTISNKLNTDKQLPEINASNIYQGSKAYMQLLENKDVDSVHISTPAYSHVMFLEAAVAAGKHVYCEKPVAPDTAGCKRALEVAGKVGSKQSVVIGFQIRHGGLLRFYFHVIIRGGVDDHFARHRDIECMKIFGRTVFGDDIAFGAGAVQVAGGHKQGGSEREQQG